MEYLNVEIKWKCSDPAKVRDYLISNGAKYAGRDQQTDTYFNVVKGRLKLREGNIENNLIYYNRANQPGPKNSYFRLTPVPEPASFKRLMDESIGIKIVVNKKREIYYIDNVKFHIDEVSGLGSFVEIEAGNLLADKSKPELEKQCRFYMEKFGIKESDLITHSYSDMLIGTPVISK